MDWIELVVFALTTWRIASLFVNEDGPGAIFRKIRSASGIVHDEAGQPYVIPEKFLPQLFSCVWCFSLWVGVFFAALWMFSPDLAFVVALPFSLSATAILISNTLSR